ncbi:MAG: class I SAM-dependent methyltransferase [Candidatus Moraniibacteriota bacterium]
MMESYKEIFNKKGKSVKSLKWNSYSSAASRYKQFIDGNVDYNGKNILDVGCGFGDIIPYLFSQAESFQYTGIDMMPEFIKIARKRYPDFKFFVSDYFSNPLKKKFDIIISCGTLNTKIPGYMKYREKAIKTMFDNCKEVLAFNMAGGSNPKNKKESKISYADSLAVLKYCLSLTNKVVFKQHYHRRDFTVFLYK